MTISRSSSSSYYLEFNKAQLRNWNAANTRDEMNIPGNVFDRQHAQRDPDEMFNYSRNLATPSGIADDVKDSENRRNWEQWEWRTIAIKTFALLFSKSKEKKSRRQISLMSMTDHSLGIGTCTQSMTIPSYLHSERHLQKFPDQTEFQSWIVHYQVEVCAKNEESRARITVAQEIEGTSSLKDLVDPESITRKDFSDYEELNLMMAAELKWCYDIVYLIYEITERGAVTRQEGEKILNRAGDWRMFSAEDIWVLFKKRRL